MVMFVIVPNPNCTINTNMSEAYICPFFFLIISAFSYIKRSTSWLGKVRMLAREYESLRRDESKPEKPNLNMQTSLKQFLHFHELKSECKHLDA